MHSFYNYIYIYIYIIYFWRKRVQFKAFTLYEFGLKLQTTKVTEFGLKLQTTRVTEKSGFLCSQFRTSLIYINNCSTRCNTKQSIYHSASSLYMFRVSITPIIRRKQNCNYSLRYWSYLLHCYLPPTWSSLATLEGSSCTVPGAVVTVLCAPDDGCG